MEDNMLHDLIFDGEGIYLDGKFLKGVTGYKLISKAGELSELTVTMLVERTSIIAKELPADG